MTTNTMHCYYYYFMSFLRYLSCYNIIQYYYASVDRYIIIIITVNCVFFG